MRLTKQLTELGLARTGGEATRLVKQGAVRVGGCAEGCGFFRTGKCDCGGWEVVKDPAFEPGDGECVKVGNGFWRFVPNGVGFDQLPGVAHAIA